MAPRYSPSPAPPWAALLAGILGLTSPALAQDSTTSNRHPTWTPDGRITFISDRDGNEEIYIMNADGTNQARRAFGMEEVFECPV